MRMCLFSVSYAGLWGQERLDTRTFVERAARLGFESVMLMGKRPHLSPLDADEEVLARLCDALRSASVRCDVVAGYTDLGPPAAAEVPALEMQISYIESLSRLAARLGAGIVRVFTAYEPPGQQAAAQDLTKIWNGAVAALREASDRAAAHGVTLAIQNHHDLALHTDALLELLHDIDRPNCRLGFDAWSPALRGEDVYQAARKAAPYAVLTTNADYVRVPRYQYRPALTNYEPVSPDWVRAVPFGEGFIDYTAFFSGLREGGFNGVAAYEMCSPVRGGGSGENLDRYAATYLRWMRAQQSGDG